MLNESTIIFPGLGLTLDPPRSFSLFGLDIYFYGVIIAVGLVLAVIYGLKRSKQFGIRSDDIIDGVLWIVPLAVVCARLYYVFSEWDQYQSFEDIINIRKGGLAIYGGVIGAALGIILYAKIKKISLPAVLDLVALGFLIGQSIGRWGNFMNREAFGSYSDSIFAMQIPLSYLGNGTGAAFDELRQLAVQINGTQYIQVHPTFLYESLWNLVGFIGLHFLSKKRRYDGQIALGYVAWYGLGRTFIEGLRMDSLYWGPFRASQLLAAVSCFIAVVVLLAMTLRKPDRKNLFVNRVAAREMSAAEAAEKPAAAIQEESKAGEETEASEESEVSEESES